MTILLPPDEQHVELLTYRVRKVTTVHYELDTAPEPSVIRRETWRDTTLYPGTSTDPARQWTFGDDPRPERVLAEVVPDDVFGTALELAITSPKHGETAGIRVFPTNSGRWDIFTPGVAYDISVPLRFVLPLQADEGDGTRGLWLSVALQVKDAIPDAQAVFAMNVKPDGRLWVQFPHGTREEVNAVTLPTDGAAFNVRLRYIGASDDTGEADLYINGVLAWRCRGRTGNPNNGGFNTSATLYGNSLVAPLAVRFGAFVIAEARDAE